MKNIRFIWSVTRNEEHSIHVVPLLHSEGGRNLRKRAQNRLSQTLSGTFSSIYSLQKSSWAYINIKLLMWYFKAFHLIRVLYYWNVACMKKALWVPSQAKYISYLKLPEVCDYLQKLETWCQWQCTPFQVQLLFWENRNINHILAKYSMQSNIFGLFCSMKYLKEPW